MKEDSTAAVQRQEKDLRSQAWNLLADMETKMLQVRDLNEVLFMAGESMSNRDHRNAITVQCDVISRVLLEAMNIRDEVASLVHGRAA